MIPFLLVPIALVVEPSAEYDLHPENISYEEYIAEDDEEELLVENEEEGPPVLIPQAKNLVLVGAEWDVLDGRDLEEVNVFETRGISIPGGAFHLEKVLLPLYLDQPITQQKIDEIKLAIYRYYRDMGFPLVNVYVPRQNVSHQTLQLAIRQSRLASLDIQGNKWSSEEQIRKSLHLMAYNAPISETKLAEGINFLNRYPFRYVSAVYRPGPAPETTDVEILVQDRRPIWVYGGTDNTGVDTTERRRFFAGFTCGGHWGIDHLLTYQYTAAYDPNKFQAHMLQYSAFFPNHHILNIYGGLSFLHANLPFPSMTQHGKSNQASLRYSISLPAIQMFAQNMQLGFDLKQTNNTLEFNQQVAGFGQLVTLTQLLFNYEGNFQRKLWRLEFNFDLFWSPGRWLPHQTDADFSSLRPSAKNHWVYSRAYLKYIQHLPWGISSINLFRGQLSSQNLLPSEQVGIGGYDTVRGYDERQLNFDEAILVSSELRAPAFSLFSKKKKDSLQFLAFIEYGYGKNHNSVPGESWHQYLLGTGPGFRYAWSNFSTRVDWGIKLHRHADFTGGWSMIHFSAIGSF